MTHNNKEGTLIRCAYCKAYLSREKFGSDASKPDGRSRRCKPCQAIRDAKKRSGVMDGRRTLILRAKEGRPCTDCKGEYPVAVMDLDHRPGTEKCFAISASGGWSIVALIDELVKCEVVCSNCHRVRTAARLQERGAPVPVVMEDPADD